MHCCSTLELIFFCQKEIENQSHRKFISHVNKLIIWKLSNVLSKATFNVETVNVKTLYHFIPPIFGNLWYAKNRNKKQKTGTKAPYGCKKLSWKSRMGCVCTGAGDAHAYMHTSSYVTTIPPESPAYPLCVRNMMLPLECSFRTISMLACGRFGSTGHALQGRTSTDRQRPRSFPRNQPDRYFQ